MTEKELINNLKELKGEVQPDKGWVNSVKSQIFDESEAFSSEENERVTFASIFSSSLFQRKAVATALASVIIMIGLFGFADRSVPGDTLYSLKRLKEQGAAMLVAEVDRPLYELERANKRLEEMEKIVRNNETENLAPAISEYKDSLKEVENITSNQDSKITEEEREAIDNLEQRENEMEEWLNNSLGSKKTFQEIRYNLDRKQTREILDNVIEFYEGRSKTENQKEILDEIKEHFENEEYEKALMKLYEISS